MKRGIAALLMAFLLAGCGAPGGSLSAEESIDDAETVLHGETFTAENGCANLALTLPEGWEGETGGYAGGWRNGRMPHRVLAR